MTTTTQKPIFPTPTGEPIKTPFFPTPTGAPIPKVTAPSIIDNLASKVSGYNIDSVAKKLSLDYKKPSITPEQVISNLSPKFADNSTTGLILNTIGGIPQAVAEVLNPVTLGQGIARTVGTIGVTAGNVPTQIYNSVTGKNEPLPFNAETPTNDSELGRIMFGGEPIRTVQNVNENVQSKLIDLGLQPKDARFYAPVFTIGGLLLDLSNFGGGKAVDVASKDIPEAFLKFVAKETDSAVIENTLKQVGLDEVNSKSLANELAKTRTTQEVKDTLVNYQKPGIVPSSEDALINEARKYSNINDFIKAQTDSKFGDIKKIDLINPKEEPYISQFANDFETKKSTASGLTYATLDKIGSLNVALKQKGFKGVSSSDFKGIYSLDKIINNPDLFSKYPTLKEVNVIFADFHTPTQKGVHIGNNIFLNSKLYTKDQTNIESTLIHEVEHAIQDIEGKLPKFNQFEQGRGMNAKEYATDLREEGARKKQQEYLDVVKTKSQLEEIWKKANEPTFIKPRTALAVEDAAQRALAGEDFGPRKQQNTIQPTTKNPAFDTGNVLDDVRNTLAHVENRVDLKETPLVKKFRERQLLLEIMKDSIDNNPVKALSKYEAKSGVFKGELPEVLGKKPEDLKTSKYYGRYRSKDVLDFIQKGDQYIEEVGYRDSEEARQAYNDYKEQVQEYKSLLKQQREEAKVVHQAIKEEEILNKISDKATQKSEADRLMAKKKAELEIAQRKINEEYAKAQDKKNKIIKEKEKPIDYRRLNTLNPLSSLDNETADIYRKFSRQMAEAKVVPLKYANKFPEDDKLGTQLYDMYQLVGDAPHQKEIQDILSRIYQHAKKHGFSDLPHRKNYLPQIYKGSGKLPDLETRKRLAKERLEKEGASPEEIKKYLDKMVDNGDQSVHLKKNAFFQQYKQFSSYAEAREYGYTPKYNKISELLGVYEKLELETTAARTLIEDLTSAGKIVPEQVAPMDWQPIKYGPHGIKGYWASPKIANFFDGVFRGHENMGLTDTLTTGIANLSRFGQNLALSGGVPASTLNFFTAGILNKELLRGNVKVFNSWVRSNSDRATVASLQKDYKYIEMMARNGISFRSIAGVPDEDYKTIKEKWGIIRKGVKENPFKLSSYSPFFQMVGDGIDSVFGKKTFDNFLPLLHVQVFRDSYNALIKDGVPDTQAQSMAAALTKMSQGIVEDVGRSQLTQDKLTALFFAPVYRESILNVLANTAKSATTEIKNPLYRFNRQLLVGMVIAFGVYQLLNKKLNGTYTWQNAQGHEADLKIPLGNGQIGYVPFMPGFLAVPRSIIGAGKGVINGDIHKAAQQAGNNLSMVIKTGVDVLTNTDYFGNPIYKDTDSRLVKLRKVAKYVGLEFNHPYVRELVNQLTDKPKPLYQSIIIASELPLKFSTQQKENTSKYYQMLEEVAKKRAESREPIKKVYDQVQELAQKGDVEGIKNLVKDFTPEQIDIYKGIVSSEKAKKTKEAEIKMTSTVLEVRKLIKQGKINEVKDLVKDFTDEDIRIYKLTAKKLK